MIDDEIEIGSSSPELSLLLDGDDIQPGSSVGYQICKTIYLYHPLGGKMVDRPIKMAMNEPRTVHVSQTFALEQRLRDAFEREWRSLGADKHIANAARIAKIYGTSAIAMLVDNHEPSLALDFRTLYKNNVSFNILDPLNTAGSIVLNQDPNAQDFQKVEGIRVAGKAYHKSRCVVIQHEDPIYLAYNPAAFGFTGRSVYQRALFPLKSFIQTMRTDDMVAVKGGLLVTKIQGPSSVVNNMMQKLSGIKRMMLKRGKTGEVLQIGDKDSIESIDLSNLEKPLDSARNHILANIAAAADMPAIILNSETFTKGFGEPQLRAQLDRRILASVDLIKLNRSKAIDTTLSRFSGWASSIPPSASIALVGNQGGMLKTAQHIQKTAEKMDYEARRVMIDQNHKLIANIDNVIATNNNAIAVEWHSHWRRPGYNYRVDHKERDKEFYLIRGNWAQKNGYVKPGKAGYLDEVDQFGEKPFCSCYGEYIYNLRSIPEDMLTQKGKKFMESMGGQKQN
ncbi:phage portal protein [Yersinia enterocolitica]